MPRPEDDHGASTSKAIGDSLVVCSAGTDLAIPPH
jgi:hypothetical protein